MGSVSMLEAIDTHRSATSCRSALICASVSASLGTLMTAPCHHRHRSSASPPGTIRVISELLSPEGPLIVVAQYTGPRLLASSHGPLSRGFMWAKPYQFVVFVQVGGQRQTRTGA